jgi:hypothetical protein
MAAGAFGPRLGTRVDRLKGEWLETVMVLQPLKGNGTLVQLRGCGRPTVRGRSFPPWQGHTLALGLNTVCPPHIGFRRKPLTRSHACTITLPLARCAETGTGDRFRQFVSADRAICPQFWYELILDAGNESRDRKSAETRQSTNVSSQETERYLTIGALPPTCGRV